MGLAEPESIPSIEAFAGEKIQGNAVRLQEELEKMRPDLCFKISHCFTGEHHNLKNRVLELDFVKSRNSDNKRIDL